MCLSKLQNVFAGDGTQLFCVTSLVAVSTVLAARCNGDPHATKRFRNETNPIYCSFSLQPAVNWSTIGHLWLFCATVGGAPSYCQASKIQKYKINDTAEPYKNQKDKRRKDIKPSVDSTPFYFFAPSLPILLSL